MAPWPGDSSAGDTRLGRVTQGGTAVPAAPLLLVTARAGGDQGETTGITGRWSGPGADDGGQREMVGTKRGQK